MPTGSRPRSPQVPDPSLGLALALVLVLMLAPVPGLALDLALALVLDFALLKQHKMTKTKKMAWEFPLCDCQYGDWKDPTLTGAGDH